jgi:hypothetical protein
MVDPSHRPLSQDSLAQVEGNVRGFAHPVVAAWAPASSHLEEEFLLILCDRGIGDDEVPESASNPSFSLLSPTVGGEERERPGLGGDGFGQDASLPLAEVCQQHVERLAGGLMEVGPSLEDEGQSLGALGRVARPNRLLQRSRGQTIHLGSVPSEALQRREEGLSVKLQRLPGGGPHQLDG